MSARIVWRMPDGMRPEDADLWHALVQDYFGEKSGLVELDLVLRDNMTEKHWRVCTAYACVGEGAGMSSADVRVPLTHLLRTAGFPVDE